MPFLILINGLPATGKTSLMITLGRELGLAYIGKDDIKEFLFDKLGVGDREYSRDLGKISIRALYLIAEEFIESGHSLIIEGAFFKEYAKPEFIALKNKFDIRIIEIYLKTEKNVRRERFKKRSESEQRHEGHLDKFNYQAMEDKPEPYDIYAPLMVGDYIEIDTTSLSVTDLETISKNIKNKFFNKKEITHEKKTK